MTLRKLLVALDWFLLAVNALAAASAVFLLSKGFYSHDPRWVSLCVMGGVLALTDLACLALAAPPGRAPAVRGKAQIWVLVAPPVVEVVLRVGWRVAAAAGMG